MRGRQRGKAELADRAARNQSLHAASSLDRFFAILGIFGRPGKAHGSGRSSARYGHTDGLVGADFADVRGRLPGRGGAELLRRHVERGDVRPEQRDDLDRHRDRPLPPSDPAEPSAVADDQLDFAVARSGRRAGRSPACCRSSRAPAGRSGRGPAPAAETAGASVSSGDSCSSVALFRARRLRRCRPAQTNPPATAPITKSAAASKAEVIGQRRHVRDLIRSSIELVTVVSRIVACHCSQAEANCK